ncbi:MAG: outer membrane lipoprotein chaperone LolA [Gammaproteobacteria bacterium]|nr:outer membrane lipoprotein chaperone LolA [Gammaproteobacteria bacterium]
MITCFCKAARFILCLALAAAAPTGAAAAGSSARQQFEKFLTNLTTLSAAFEQRVYDEKGALLETSSGTVAIARPRKFAWIYTKPYAQSIISDGNTLWLYDKELAQVTVNAVAASAAGSAAQLLGEKVNIDQQYTVKALGEHAGGAWFKLTPKQAGQQYTAIEIGMSKEVISAMKLADNLGQTTELKFADLVRNKAIPESIFNFQPPVGVDVVTGTSLSK